MCRLLTEHSSHSSHDARSNINKFIIPICIVQFQFFVMKPVQRASTSVLQLQPCPAWWTWAWQPAAEQCECQAGANEEFSDVIQSESGSRCEHMGEFKPFKLVSSLKQSNHNSKHKSLPRSSVEGTLYFHRGFTRYKDKCRCQVFGWTWTDDSDRSPVCEICDLTRSPSIWLSRVAKAKCYMRALLKAYKIKQGEYHREFAAAEFVHFYLFYFFQVGGEIQHICALGHCVLGCRYTSSNQDLPALLASKPSVCWDESSRSGSTRQPQNFQGSISNFQNWLVTVHRQMVAAAKVRCFPKPPDVS